MHTIKRPYPPLPLQPPTKRGKKNTRLGRMAKNEMHRKVCGAQHGHGAAASFPARLFSAHSQEHKKPLSTSLRNSESGFEKTLCVAILHVPAETPVSCGKNGGAASPLSAQAFHSLPAYAFPYPSPPCGQISWCRPGRTVYGKQPHDGA